MLNITAHYVKWMGAALAKPPLMSLIGAAEVVATGQYCGREIAPMRSK